MKQQIYSLASHLEYRYSRLVNEIIAQKDLFPSPVAYTQVLVKYAAILNRLQGVKLRNS